MNSSITTPAVYVGTYHQYNCGSIFGKWFDLTDFDDEDAFYGACRTLHAGEEDPELMFQDIEGIPSQFASESSVKWAFIEAFRQAPARPDFRAGNVFYILRIDNFYFMSLFFRLDRKSVV